jgi:hypothetical protein
MKSIVVFVSASFILAGCMANEPTKPLNHPVARIPDHTHLIWCRGEPKNCFTAASVWCGGTDLEGGKQHSEPGEWRAVAVGTNVPVMTPTAEGYSLWITCIKDEQH